MWLSDKKKVEFYPPSRALPIRALTEGLHFPEQILVRHVFPRLRAWAEPRRIRIVECDLRWGVPKGAKNETIFRTCLEEVDRCVLANSQCFFLNMLSGKR